MADLAPANLAASITVDEEAVLRAIGINTRDPKHQAAMLVARQYDLDPVLKHVVVVEGNVFITRDGLLHVAHASGQLDGIVLEELTDRGDEWEAVVSVYRKDMGHPFRFPGRYPKIQQTKRGPRDHPYAPEMAVKCAESHALRRAFSVGGLGIVDEIHDAGSPAASSTRGGPAPAPGLPSPNIDRLLDALKAKVDRLNTNHHECWEAWKADNDGWWTTVDGLTAADMEVVRMLQAQGADPFLDDAAGSASLESGGAGGGGDEAASTDESAVPPPAADLTNTGGDDNKRQPEGLADGVVRETERSGDPDPPVEPPPGSGSSAPNPVTQARKKAAKT